MADYFGSNNQVISKLLKNKVSRTQASSSYLPKRKRSDRLDRSVVEEVSKNVDKMLERMGRTQQS